MLDRLIIAQAQATSRQNAGVSGQVVDITHEATGFVNAFHVDNIWDAAVYIVLILFVVAPIATVVVNHLLKKYIGEGLQKVHHSVNGNGNKNGTLLVKIKDIEREQKRQRKLLIAMARKLGITREDLP